MIVSIDSFLEKNKCAITSIEPVSSDWGMRSYVRVTHPQGTRIVMMCKDETTRAQIPPFLKIAHWLREIGISAPEIFDVDEQEGLVLLEDFGTHACHDYDLIGSCLKHVQAHMVPPDLPCFQETPVYKGHRRVVDYFLPSIAHHKNEEGVLEGYLAHWAKIEQQLPIPQLGFIHIDCHPANFMLLKGREGIQQCGFLDFQDGCLGPIAYDYTNLLRDIRRDVSQEVQARLLTQATQEMNAEQKENFEMWYRFLSVQFHCRIAGQVIKLSLNNGRDDLLEFLPRVTGYLKEELQDDLFTDLNQFFTAQGLDWSTENLKIDPEFIAPTAF